MEGLFDNYDIDNFIMYLRKSRADNASESVLEVLSKHEDIMQRFCKEKFGKEMPERNIYREVVSGETIADRPEFQSILKMLEVDTSIKGIVVVEPQRLTRGSRAESGHVMDVLRYTNTMVVTPMHSYDLKNEIERKFFETELDRGNDYLEYMKKIMMRGRKNAKINGWFQSPNAPYGYDKVHVKEGNKKHCTLKKNEDSEAIEMVFDMFVNQKASYNSISKALTECGYKPQTLDYWSRGTIRTMLMNPTYAGKIRVGYAKTTHNVINGEIVKKVELDKNYENWEIYEGKHEAIIDWNTFEKAQIRLKEFKPCVKVDYAIRNPFAGILRCKKCGHTMRLKKGTKNSHRKDYFLCLTPNCNTYSVRKGELYERVQKILLESIKDFCFNDDEEKKKKGHAKELQIKALRRDIISLNKKDAKQKDAYEDGVYTKLEYIKRNNDLKNILRGKEKKLLLLETEDDTEQLEQLKTFKECIENLPNEENIEFLNGVFRECIEYMNYTNHAKKRKYNQENVFDLEIKLKL